MNEKCKSCGKVHSIGEQENEVIEGLSAICAGTMTAMKTHNDFMFISVFKIDGEFRRVSTLGADDEHNSRLILIEAKKELDKIRDMVIERATIVKSNDDMVITKEEGGTIKIKIKK